ncbi:MAG: hypothetical protein IVW54_22675 [Candidatus Binataceae bacterium]|nr:hypothetical protein [Candidatus Binataceae bacterium]
MLWDIDRNQEIGTIPHPDGWKALSERLDPAEFQAIIDELNSKIDGSKIQTSSWMPGADWTGTAYQAIYEKAARFDTQLAAKLFGLMVWYTFMQRDEYWAFGRFEKDGVPIEGLTYFRVDP